jgi:hypothetical protein
VQTASTGYTFYSMGVRCAQARFIRGVALAMFAAAAARRRYCVPDNIVGRCVMMFVEVSDRAIRHTRRVRRDGARTPPWGGLEPSCMGVWFANESRNEQHAPISQTRRSTALASRRTSINGGLVAWTYRRHR